MSENTNPLTPTETIIPEKPAGDPAANAPEQKNFFSMIGDDGKFGENAWDHYPVPEGEDAGKYARIGKKFNDVQGLVKGYSELEGLLSHDKIPMPKPEDGPEAWDRVYDAMGRPAEPKYELSEGIQIDDGTKGELDAAFHKAGLSQRQADVLHGITSEILAQSAQANADAESASAESAIQALEQEVGPRNSQAYAQSVEQAEIAANHLGLNDPSLFAIPGFAAKMASLHDKLLASGVKGVTETTISHAQDLDAEIKAIQHDPNHRLYAAYRREDPAAHKYVQDLFTKKFEAAQAGSQF